MGPEWFRRKKCHSAIGRCCVIGCDLPRFRKIPKHNTKPRLRNPVDVAGERHEFDWYVCLSRTFQEVEYKASGFRLEKAAALGDWERRNALRGSKIGRNHRPRFEFDSMNIISLQDVGKYYLTDGQRVLALDGVSLDVRPGELIALVGRSGCGKSTLLNLAGAMDFPSSGEVFLDGMSTTGLADGKLTLLRRKMIGFIFQSFQLLHTLTVIENVELPLMFAGDAKAREKARERLWWVELENLEGRFPHQLSGGQMQRVAIARALVHSPKILLADEPTGNLDTATGSLILNLLRRLTGEQQTATIMATHSLEAAAVATRIVRLRDGHIEERCTS